MQTSDGRFLIVYNGEVYNHTDLRREFKGVGFHGHSDTETILNCLAANGIAAVRRLNGIFALGLVDVRGERLYLARDPFGVKPLYYYHRGKYFVFSSEIRPIQKLMDDSVDPANLAELLRLRYSPSPDTLFRQIKKGRPGHIVEVDLSREDLSIREYPFIEPPTEGIPISFEDAVEHYGELFERAVERQLMSDVEVGIFLSGGVDSALVAAFAQKHTTGRMKAFTVGFQDKDKADEISDACETASAIGLEHIHTRIGFEDFFDSIRKCTVIVEEPLATTSIVPMFHLAELAARSVKVVLSGQGADESLGGYARYQGELYREYIPPSFAKVALPALEAAGLRNDKILRGLKSLGEERDLERFLSWSDVFNDEEIVRLTGERDGRSRERIQYFYDLLQCRDRKNSAERMMSIDLRMGLSDDLLLYTDKITMHHSIECRVPMLDLELVRFIESLPYDYRVGMRRGKIIHKRFARRVLPKHIVHRRKKGFLSPTKSWFRRGDLLREILINRSSHFASFLDLGEVERVIKEHENGFNRERHIFLLLSLYYWFAEYA
jgi:asparagine synthase (glutamine-hydrolysing)